jgi:hypothetical protein
VLYANPERLKRFGIRMPDHVMREATLVREGEAAR